MDTENWKWFRYDEIFDIKKGKRLTKADMEDGDIPYIGAIDSNNGMSSKIGNDKYIHEGNTITVSYNGSIGYAYYQEKPFWATDDVNVFYPKFAMNKYIAHFLCTLIEKERYRFCYGRKWSLDSMKDSKMPLPTTVWGTPNWQYMEDYVKQTIIPQLPEKAKKIWIQSYDKTPMSGRKAHELSSITWHGFLPKDIFEEIEIGKSYDLNSLEVDKNGVQYLGRGITNNGIQTKVNPSGLKVYDSGYISVVMVGVPSTAFYQESPFVCSQNMLLLRNRMINKYSALFICSMLEKEQYRYSYGRTLSKSIFMELPIKLPAILQSDGTYTPNWQFMEDYIKSLPYSRNI